MSMKIVWLGLVSVGLVGGCAPDENFPEEEASETASPLASGSMACPVVPPACGVPASGIEDTFANPLALAHDLTGIWLACDAKYAGLELRPGGHVYALVNDHAGHCSRARGFGAEGTWSVEDISEQNPRGTYQVSVRWTGGGTTGLVPSLSRTPRLLRDRGPADLGTFARWF